MSSVLLAIQQNRDQLTKTEIRIADFILSNPAKVVANSVQELSQQIPTSASSIVRFSQKFCGDGGFSALKLNLSAEASHEQQLYQEISPQDSLTDLEKKLSFRIEQSLQLTNQSIDIEQIKQAAQKIHTTESLLIFGIGASQIAANDLQQKFIRIGKTANCFSSTHLISTLLLSKPKNSVLILFSNSGQTKEILQVAKLAQQNNVSVIAITQDNGNWLQLHADIVLLTSKTTESDQMRTAATTSLVDQLYVIDLLYYDYFSLDFAKHRELVKKSHRFIQKNYREG